MCGCVPVPWRLLAGTRVSQHEVLLTAGCPRNISAPSVGMTSCWILLPLMYQVTVLTARTPYYLDANNVQDTAGSQNRQRPEQLSNAGWLDQVPMPRISHELVLPMDEHGKLIDFDPSYFNIPFDFRKKDSTLTSIREYTGIPQVNREFSAPSDAHHYYENNLHPFKDFSFSLGGNVRHSSSAHPSLKSTADVRKSDAVLNSHSQVSDSTPWVSRNHLSDYTSLTTRTPSLKFTPTRQVTPQPNGIRVIDKPELLESSLVGAKQTQQATSKTSERSSSSDVRYSTTAPSTVLRPSISSDLNQWTVISKEPARASDYKTLYRPSTSSATRVYTTRQDLSTRSVLSTRSQPSPVVSYPSEQGIRSPIVVKRRVPSYSGSTRRSEVPIVTTYKPKYGLAERLRMHFQQKQAEKNKPKRESSLVTQLSKLIGNRPDENYSRPPIQVIKNSNAESGYRPLQSVSQQDNNVVQSTYDAPVKGSAKYTLPSSKYDFSKWTDNSKVKNELGYTSTAPLSISSSGLRQLGSKITQAKRDWMNQKTLINYDTSLDKYNLKWIESSIAKNPSKKLSTPNRLTFGKLSADVSNSNRQKIPSSVTSHFQNHHDSNNAIDVQVSLQDVGRSKPLKDQYSVSTPNAISSQFFRHIRPQRASQMALAESGNPMHPDHQFYGQRTRQNAASDNGKPSPISQTRTTQDHTTLPNTEFVYSDSQRSVQHQVQHRPPSYAGSFQYLNQEMVHGGHQNSHRHPANTVHNDYSAAAYLDRTPFKRAVIQIPNHRQHTSLSAQLKHRAFVKPTMVPWEPKESYDQRFLQDSIMKAKHPANNVLASTPPYSASSVTSQTSSHAHLMPNLESQSYEEVDDPRDSQRLQSSSTVQNHNGGVIHPVESAQTAVPNDVNRFSSLNEESPVTPASTSVPPTEQSQIGATSKHETTTEVSQSVTSDGIDDVQQESGVVEQLNDAPEDADDYWSPVNEPEHAGYYELKGGHYVDEYGPHAYYSNAYEQHSPVSFDYIPHRPRQRYEHVKQRPRVKQQTKTGWASFFDPSRLFAARNSHQGDISRHRRSAEWQRSSVPSGVITSYVGDSARSRSGGHRSRSSRLFDGPLSVPLNWNFLPTIRKQIDDLSAARTYVPILGQWKDPVATVPYMIQDLEHGVPIDVTLSEVLLDEAEERWQADPSRILAQSQPYAQARTDSVVRNYPASTQATPKADRYFLSDSVVPDDVVPNVINQIPDELVPQGQTDVRESGGDNLGSANPTLSYGQKLFPKLEYARDNEIKTAKTAKEVKRIPLAVAIYNTRPTTERPTIPTLPPTTAGTEKPDPTVAEVTTPEPPAAGNTIFINQRSALNPARRHTTQIKSEYAPEEEVNHEQLLQSFTNLLFSNVKSETDTQSRKNSPVSEILSSEPGNTRFVHQRTFQSNMYAGGLSPTQIGDMVITQVEPPTLGQPFS